MDDLYAALGVPKTATADEIKKAYREGAFKYHPDRNPGSKAAEEKFKTISAAYAVLGDPAKRQEYDRYGSADEFARASRTSGWGQTGDPFWDWFNDMQQEAQRNGGHTYTWHTWTSGEAPRETYQETRSGALASLVRSGLMLWAGLFFFRFLLFLLPIGPILAIGAVINGASGVVRALRRLFSPNKT